MRRFRAVDAIYSKNGWTASNLGKAAKPGSASFPRFGDSTSADHALGFCLTARVTAPVIAQMRIAL
jgi:hypothetical protein